MTALTGPQRATRRIILQKARRHLVQRLRLRVSTRFQVLFHSPRRGAFHRSLTVLVHYRSLRVVSLGAWSPPLHAGLLVSGATQARDSRADAPSTTRLSRSPAPLSSRLRLTHHARGGGRQPPRVSPCNPTTATAASLARSWFRLPPVRSPLLRGWSLFLGVLRCFSSPGALRHWRCPSERTGCPIRRSWDHSLLAAPPRISLPCRVLHRRAAPRHPPCAPPVFPAGTLSVLGILPWYVAT